MKKAKTPSSGTSDSDSDSDSDTLLPRRKCYKKKKDCKKPEKKEVIQHITDLSELLKCGASSTSKVSVDLSQLTSLVEYVQ